MGQNVSVKGRDDIYRFLEVECIDRDVTYVCDLHIGERGSVGRHILGSQIAPFIADLPWSKPSPRTV